MGVWWYLTAALLSISLVIRDVEPHDMLQDHLYIFFQEGSVQNFLPILIGSFPWQFPPLSSGLTIWQLWFSGSPGKKDWVFPWVASVAAIYTLPVELSLMLKAGKQKLIWCSSPDALFHMWISHQKSVCIQSPPNTLDVAFLCYVWVFCSPWSSRRVLNHHVWTFDIMYFHSHSVYIF